MPRSVTCPVWNTSSATSCTSRRDMCTSRWSWSSYSKTNSRHVGKSIGTSSWSGTRSCVTSGTPSPDVIHCTT